MRFRVETAFRVTADRDSNFDTAGEDGPDRALDWLNAYEQTVAALRDDPGRELAAENSDHEVEVLQRWFGASDGLRYRILFTIASDAIYILGVRGPQLDVSVHE